MTARAWSLRLLELLWELGNYPAMHLFTAHLLCLTTVALSRYLAHDLNFGVRTRRGTAMAVESASVVMVRDEIGMIPNLISLSQRCKQRIRENIFLAVAIKIVFVGLALSSVLTELWVAVLVDGISVLLVLANSGRGLRSFKQSTNDAPIDDPIDDSVIITPRDVIASPTFKMSEV
jgi:hypothetical protein